MIALDFLDVNDGRKGVKSEYPVGANCEMQGVIAHTRLTMRSPSIDDGRVVHFRPRGAAPQAGLIGPRWQANENASVKNPAKHEMAAESDDNHRTLVNIIAAVIIILLMIMGGWVIRTMAEMQSDQDCSLSVSTNCSQIYVPQVSARHLAFLNR